MEIIKTNTEQLVDGLYLFSTPHCPTCDRLKKEMVQIELDVQVTELNAYEHREICQQLGLIGTPCLIDYRDNREYDRMYGAPSEKQLIAFLKGE